MFLLMLLISFVIVFTTVVVLKLAHSIVDAAKLVVEHGEGARRVDGLELTLRVQRWKDARSPEGQELARFMAPRDPSIVVSNRAFFIGGTNYITLFARPNLKGRRDGTLFVTANEMLIFIDPSKNYMLLTNKTLPK